MRYFCFFVICTLCACSHFTLLNDKNITSSSESLLLEINKVRRQYDLPILIINNELDDLSLEYSKYMAKEEFFAHKDPKNRRLNRRLSQSGITFLLAAENLAWVRNGNLVTSEVIEAWLKSKDHKVNLLDAKFTETGIGIASNNKGHYYITQIFLQPNK